MELNCIAPLITPLNFDSESISKKQDSINAIKEELILPGFSVHELGWNFTYGDTRNDIIPLFFQPIIHWISDQDFLETTNELYKELLKKYDLTVKDISITLYDDTLALVKMVFLTSNLSILETSTEELNVFLSNITNQFIHHHIVSSFYKGLPTIKKLSKKHHALRNPSQFLVFKNRYNKVTDEFDKTLWVSRYILLNSDEKEKYLKSELIQNWVPETKIDESENIFVGAGNSLLIGKENEVNWLKMYYLLQYYYAICTLLSKKVEEIFDQENINTLKKRDLIKYLGRINRRIDHFEFVKIKMGQTVLGIQSVRKKIYKTIHNTWNVDLLEQNIEEWQLFIQRRIIRINETIKRKQGKRIQNLLAIIGGIGIIDVLFLFAAEGRNNKDSIPGLLDVFAEIPLDLVVWITIPLIIVFVIINSKD